MTVDVLLAATHPGLGLELFELGQFFEHHLPVGGEFLARPVDLAGECLHSSPGG